jgi:hypothetical protein
MWRSIDQHRCFLLWKSLVEVSSRKSANLTKILHYIYIYNVMFVKIIIIYIHNNTAMTIIIIIIITQSIMAKSVYYTHKRNFF